jgi:hypothetical protein
MTEDKMDALVLAEVSYPVPAMHALDTDDQIVAIGFDQLHEQIWLGRDLFVQ